TPPSDENEHIAFNVQLSPTKPEQDLSSIPSAPIIEDWVSDSEEDEIPQVSKDVPSFAQSPELVKSPRHSGQLYHLLEGTYPDNHLQTPVIPLLELLLLRYLQLVLLRANTADVPKPHVTRLRPAKPIVTKPHSPPRRHTNRSPSPKASNFPLKITTVKAPMVNAAKGVQGKWEWKPKCPILDHASCNTSASMTLKRFDYNDGNPEHALKDKGVIDSGCSRHMIGNMSYLSNFEELNGRYIAFGGNPKGGKISGKGRIMIGKLKFDDVYFVKELKFNHFSVSQMCDKKNSVLFIDTECLVLSPDFKLPDDNQVLLRVPRKNNMYNVNLKNIVSSEDLTCLFAKATLDETLIEAARTMLADLLLPILFWDEAVNTACYVQNRVLVTKPQNKTPYELFHGKTSSMGFMRPFGCLVTILNTLDSLGKFDGKVDEGFLVGYTNTDGDAAFDDKEPEFEGRKPESEVNVSPCSSAQSKKHDDKTKIEAKGKILAVGQISTYNTNTFSVVGPSNTVVSPTQGKSSYVDSFQLSDDPNMLELKDITYSDDEDDVGYTQEEGIDYEEVFAPVARIEAIRFFLAYASFMGFMLYQMDVKSDFLFGTIEEEVYICQPLGFEDPDYPDKIYVDDIIFGSTNKDLCKAFEKLMKHKFQMSSMRELTFFLGLQVKQKKDRIFISQDKYIAEILRKSGLTDRKSASTLIDTEKPLLKDPDGEDVDVHTYRSMIGSLIYLTSSRPDIMFAVYACAHFQVTPKASHLHVNDVSRLQALVDRKKVIITKATIRDALRLDDAEGVECLPNEEIFVELARMGYEKPSTKLTFYKAFFSSRKFNFSKYVFDSLVRNVDSPTKFYMYPRFLKLMIRKQVGDLSSHTTKYSSVALTQKVFANMRRIGKGFFGVETSLFEGMIVEQQVGKGADEVHVDDVSTAGVAAEGAASVADDEVPAAVNEPSIPSPLPPTLPPQPSQDQPYTS
nr:ribonuclease H-like domain-containing protein [Tanacetum cinerariifolium]